MPQNHPHKSAMIELKEQAHPAQFFLSVFGLFELREKPIHRSMVKDQEFDGIGVLGILRLHHERTPSLRSAVK
jgi:hypothetical protein